MRRNCEALFDILTGILFTLNHILLLWTIIELGFFNHFQYAPFIILWAVVRSAANSFFNHNPFRSRIVSHLLYDSHIDRNEEEYWNDTRL